MCLTYHPDESKKIIERLPDVIKVYKVLIDMSSPITGYDYKEGLNKAEGNPVSLPKFTDWAEHIGLYQLGVGALHCWPHLDSAIYDKINYDKSRFHIRHKVNIYECTVAKEDILATDGTQIAVKQLTLLEKVDA